MQDIDRALDQTARLIEEADALIIAAGEGMEIDSNLPNFRSDKGLWKAYPALGKARISFVNIANKRAFQRSPHLAWRFYGHWLALYSATIAHQGFAWLRQWAQYKTAGARVFSSNVDGQFQKAGFSASHVEECHASLQRVQCIKPCTDLIWSADSLQPSIDEDRSNWWGPLPQSPQCSHLLRPKVLMFEDWYCNHLPMEQAKLQRGLWMDRLTTQTWRPMIIESGAGTAIPNVRHVAERCCHEIKRLGARLIRINRRECTVPGADNISLPLTPCKGLAPLHNDLNLRKRTPSQWANYLLRWVS